MKYIYDLETGKLSQIEKSAYGKHQNIVIGILFCLLLGYFLGAFMMPSVKSTENSMQIVIKECEKVLDTIPVTVTVYNPTIEQCGEDFMNTASMKRIPNDLTKIHWCAISRDLFFWHYNFFDTLEIHTGDLTIDGKYLITDIMPANKRRCVDILSYKSTGKWEGYILLKNK